MVFLLNTRTMPWRNFAKTVQEFADDNNCVILKTGIAIPQWLQCSEEDLLLIKIKTPYVILTSFTDEDFQQSLEKVLVEKRHANLTKMDMLALRLRSKYAYD